jgi:hypothetical protein
MYSLIMIFPVIFAIAKAGSLQITLRTGNEIELSIKMYQSQTAMTYSAVQRKPAEQFS